MVILKSKSYIIFQNLPDHLQLAMSSFGKSNNFKCLFTKDTEESLALAKQVFHLLGVFVNSTEVNKEDYSSLTNRIGFLSHNDISSIGDDKQIEHLHSLLLYELENLIPKSLKNLSKDSFEYICKEFADIDVSIENSSQSPGFERNCLVSCESTGGNLSYYISFEFNSHKTFQNHPSADNLLALFREIANQTLGVINSQLADIPIHSRIGLPYSLQPYDAKISSIKQSFHYPSISFKNKEHNLLVSFGFLSTEKQLPEVNSEVKKASSFEIF